VQADRDLTVTTPLGSDVLLLRGLIGRESISKPFVFRLDLIATNATEVPFDRLLGQKVTAHMGLPQDEKRHFSGICNRVAQGHRDATFTYYGLDIVPHFWLLKLRRQSRIFQQLAVPDILKKVLDGLDVVYQIRGTFHPRDFCVQYRESDFDFASRLMEEEGIYYFFVHSSDGHQMVVANTPQSHPPLADPAPVVFETSEVGKRQAGRINSWKKRQALRSGQFTLRDHSFELPADPLAASKTIPASVQAGQVEHRLRIGRNERLEVYDYPGGYAGRFDGVDPGGGDRPSDLEHLQEDKSRTVEIRMQERTVPSLVVTGSGHCRFLAAGSKFAIEGHPNADGSYILLKVKHAARLAGDYRSDMGGELTYRNVFECIPSGVPFRPRRVTPKRVVKGTQTAVVVGPQGEEIYTDKYGRVKVQFFWDREGKHDADSSCWIRVAQFAAGAGFGAIHIPRVGQEVVVAFEEGDPDRPIITGSVYNPSQMPPFALPAKKMFSGFRSNTYPHGGGNNEISVDDSKGKERMFIHAQYNQDSVIDHNCTAHVKVDSSEAVGHNLTETVGNDKSVTIGNNSTKTVVSNYTQSVGANYTQSVVANRTRIVGQNEAVTVAMMRTHSVGINDMLNVGAAQEISIGGLRALSVGLAHIITVGLDQMLTVAGSSSESIGKSLVINAGDAIILKTGAASLTMMNDGTIKIEGKDIQIKGSGNITAKASGDMVLKATTIGQN